MAGLAARLFSAAFDFADGSVLTIMSTNEPKYIVYVNLHCNIYYLEI